MVRSKVGRIHRTRRSLQVAAVQEAQGRHMTQMGQQPVEAVELVEELQDMLAVDLEEVHQDMHRSLQEAAEERQGHRTTRMDQLPVVAVVDLEQQAVDLEERQVHHQTNSMEVHPVVGLQVVAGREGRRHSFRKDHVPAGVPQPVELRGREHREMDLLEEREVEGRHPLGLDWHHSCRYYFPYYPCRPSRS